MSLVENVKQPDLSSSAVIQTQTNRFLVSSQSHSFPESLQQNSVLKLPSDFLKTPTTPYQPECYKFSLQDNLDGFFPAQGQSSLSLTSQSFLLAAFNTLLHRYTQQETLTLQLTLPAPNLVKSYTTEIRTEIHPQLTLKELFTHTTITLEQIYSSAQQLDEQVTIVPCESLACVSPVTDLPVAITFVETEQQGDELVAEVRSLTAGQPNYDLHLVVAQQEQALTGILAYNASLFLPDTVQRLAGHLQGLTASLVQQLMQPETQREERTIAQLPLLTQAEVQALLAAGDGGQVLYPPQPIYRYIETQALQQPHAVALTFRDQQLTYGDLNRRANQLAHYLTQQGVGPAVAVAVCVEPGLEIVICLLAVFKASGVYVPLDPTYPQERLLTILEDTRPQVVLTQSHLQSRLPALTATVFCCDRDGTSLEAFPTHNLAEEPSLDQTAYLIYTSGTTGKPKGVMASHGNLVNYISVAQEQFGFNPQDVMPAIARFTFSITMFELLSPLVAGGQLVILERDHILDFQRLVKTLEQLTIIHTSPSLMRRLLAYIQENELDQRAFQRLRHVSCGGDLVSGDLLETMKTVFPAAEIFVIYGCSEISCMGCTYPVPRDQTMTRSRVGKPFANVSVRLYDPQQTLVPIGVTGEIYFGGAGITQGYLHQPALTQEKFVTIDGERFYRTGDLGRWDGAGNLEILGRNDFQIQLRGMRIEPGEIEVTLRQIPLVRDAVVVARELHGELSLVAYVVLDPEHPPELEEIRRFLQSKLPDYMVPAVFVPLEAMPLTPNQKVDRRSLPAPDLARPSAVGTEAAPRNELERLIAGIWSTILKLDPIGIHDDFFALGGHSLLATQVIDRLRTALKLALPISCIFEFPTIATLADHLLPLCQAADDHGVDLRFAPIVAAERPREIPLSFAQANLWFLSQLEEGRTLNIPLAWELRGELDSVALEQSLSEIVRRHETLRTVYALVNGVPVQRILPVTALALPLVDLQALPAATQSAEVQRLATLAAQHRFNLATDLPVQVSLLRLNATTHILLLTIHHIAGDGWSLEVLHQELATLYTAFSQGQPAPLAELPIQYADFVLWQQQWLKPELLQPQLAYWQQQLAGAPPLLELPTDRPRPAQQTFVGGTAFVTLEAQLTQQLKTLSQRHGVTLFMTLLAALATLLARYSGQSDLVIGSPIANRQRQELEPLIGFFINVLALRVDLSGNLDFATLLQRVRQVTLGAYANQDIPFGQVREAVQPERNLSHSPLFQVMFVLQNSPSEAVQLPGLILTPLEVESGFSQYDLRLMLEETEEGLQGGFEYNRDLFDPTTIARLVGHFQTLLQAIVTDAARPIATLPLLSPTERQQLFALTQGTPAGALLHQGMHEWFEAQVMRTPTALALISQQQTLTYQELNQRANQLAHYLRSLQVAPGDRVAICAERSPELLIGFLGVLKAGAAYVPIDPAYPVERQAYMLQDAQVKVVLTQASLISTLPPQPVPIVQLDADWSTIAQSPSDNLPATLTGEEIAYVIYTSGSTGAPKGVMITHRGLVNHSTAMAAVFDLQPCDRMLQFSSLSFDIAVEEIFPTLIRGAALVLRTEACLAVRPLMQFVREHQITVLDLPTAFWHEIVNELPHLGQLPDSLRLVIVGGEKAAKPAYTTWCQYVGDRVRWLNTYGPTETTVTATLYEPDPKRPEAIPSEIPIGRPLANTQIYILDAQLQPVPLGIPGELHIAGAGLARGYLNRPELTQEKFIPNPFGRDRLYKTGDLARYLPDGNLEFLGRIDQQVKIRGFRIELGEIEAILGQHPQVRDVVVLARADQRSQKYLVAYLVSQAGTPLQPETLRAFLRDRLPDYMLPSAFVFLEALPLTPNGKVDRRALPAPDLSAGRDRQDTRVAPRDQLEQDLTEIWQEVLAVPTIGITDNFFELGGHSLLAVRLWSKIEALLNRELPLATLFQAPTIEQLAARLRQRDATPLCPSLVLLQTGSTSSPVPPLFCIHVLGRGMRFYRPLLHHLDPQLQVYGLSTNITGESLPSERLEDLATYYAQQMRTIQPTGPYLLMGISFGGMVAFEIAQQLMRQGQVVGFLGLVDTYAPGSVQIAPLANQMQQHWRSLARMGPTYIAKKLRDKGSGSLQLLSGKSSHLYQKLQLKLYNTVKLTLPEDLQDFMHREQSRQLASTYTVQPYPGQAVLFKALEQSTNVSLHIDPKMGWEPFVQGGLKVYDVPGDHLGMLQPPHVKVLAEKLQEALGIKQPVGQVR